MAKKSKKKDRGKQARAVGAAGGVGAFAGTLAGKVVERLLAQRAAKYIDQLLTGKQAGKLHRAERHDTGTAILVALAGESRAVPVSDLVAGNGSEVLSTVEAIHKLRRARLLKYADGRRAVQLTQHGRDLLARLTGPGESGVAPGGDGDPESGFGSDAGNGRLEQDEPAQDVAAVPAE